jgi:hypothetical protein
MGPVTEQDQQLLSSSCLCRLVALTHGPGVQWHVQECCSKCRADHFSYKNRHVRSASRSRCFRGWCFEHLSAPSRLRRRNDSGALSQTNVTPHVHIVNLDNKTVSRIITHRGASRMRAAAVTGIAAGSRLLSGGSKVESRGPCADPDAFHRLKA